MLRRFTILVTCITTLFTLCLSSAPALAADEIGTPGIATDLELLTPSAETYLQYHGRLVVQVGPATTPTFEEYRWGGTSCGSRTVSDDDLALLVESVRRGQKVTVRYQSGQGNARCLVGFTTE